MKRILFRIPHIIFHRINTVLLFSFFGTQCINAQQLLWQRVFDTGNEDQSTDVAIDFQGNIIVVGSIMPPQDAFLIVKYDSSGDKLWTRRFDVSPYDRANGVAVDKAGNIIVVGFTRTDTTTDGDAQVVKYDKYGNVLWTQTYGNAGKLTVATAVTVDSKNNIIITGVGIQTFSRDYLTIKYDSSGNILWERWYDGGWNDCAMDITTDFLDNLIVTGYSDSNINWDWCTIKYNSDGDLLWIKRYDISITDWAHSVITDKIGNVIVVGETRYLHGSGGATAMVAKYSSGGDTLWSKIFTDTLKYSEVARFVDVTTDKNGNIYLSGIYVAWDETGRIWKDYYVAKCSVDGDTLWTTIFDFNVSDEPSAIALDKDGNIIVTGTTSSNPDWGEYDYLTVKLYNKITGVNKENILPNQYLVLQNYPNPFNSVTTIKYQIPDKCFISLKIYDLLGREIETLVKEEKLAGAYTLRWNAEKLTSGIYIARLTTSNWTATQKLVLIR